MKIVLTSAGSRGDVYPLLYLGRGLKRRGYEVAFATTPDYKELCEAEGFAFYETGTDFRDLMEEFEGNMGKPLKVMTQGVKTLRRELQWYFDGTMKAAKGADLLVCSGIQFTGPAVAETLGIPYRYVVHIPILNPSAYHAPFFVPFQNLPKWLNRFFWFLDIMGSRFTVNRTMNTIRARAGLAPRRDIMDHVDPASMVVAVAPELGPIAPDNQDIGLQTDYLFDSDEGELSAEMELFLAEGSAPIYFGFGSMTDGSAEKTLTVIFEVVKRLGIRAVISRGWANYAVEKVPEGVLFVGEEPHGKLFPRMACIIHHGGAGTTSQAARAGIPQITMPHVLDQYYWTNRLVKLGVSPGGITKRNFSSQRLIAKVREVLESSAIRDNARRLGAKLRGRDGIAELLESIEEQLHS